MTQQESIRKMNISSMKPAIPDINFGKLERNDKNNYFSYFLEYIFDININTLIKFNISNMTQRII